MDLIERSAKLEKKKKKSSSLVERAAEQSGTSPFKEVGSTPKEGFEHKRRDPSSMNPVSTEPTARRIGAIGDAEAKKAKEAEGGDLQKDTEGLDQEIEPRSLSIGVGRGKGTSPSAPAKEARV